MDLENKKEALVIDYFINAPNNSSAEIAKIFELNLWTVNKILTKYLKSKHINE